MSAQPEPPEWVNRVADLNMSAYELYGRVLSELYERLEEEPSYRDAIAIETAAAKLLAGGVHIATAEITHVINERAREVGSTFGIEVYHQGPVEDRWFDEFGDEEQP